MKIQKKYSGLLMAFIMTVLLDTTMTFAMMVINTGLTEGFVFRFVNGWLIGFMVAFPTSIAVIPLAKRITAKLVE